DDLVDEIARVRTPDPTWAHVDDRDRAEPPNGHHARARTLLELHARSSDRGRADRVHGGKVETQRRRPRPVTPVARAATGEDRRDRVPPDGRDFGPLTERFARVEDGAKRRVHDLAVQV